MPSKEELLGSLGDRTRVPVASLEGFCRRVFEKVGVPEEDARIAAEVLVAADVRGTESHGVARLRGLYVNRLQAGVISVRPEIRVLRETPATVLLDGGAGLGAAVSLKAMGLAIEKAREVGAGFVTVRNSTHFGIAAYWAMMALESGCIGLAMTNTNRWGVPTFGREAMLGTNPLAVAVPTGRQRPFVLDMATLTVAQGQLEVRDRLGIPMPLGWAVDDRGVPTDDAGAVLRSVPASGGLLPLGGAGEETGGHKGYGLAVWVDIFSALLSGASCADQVRYHDAEGRPREADLGHFFGAWRVDAFRPLDEFRADVDGLLERLKASRKAEGQGRIYVAGEKEFEEAERRRRDGIPVPAVVLADLRALGSELGVEFDA